ncbi:diguanylate cyclase/phosphodiesterase [Planococcus sp. PAMC 21323]|uniref:EAL domain-containing protein n=1 Tax=Planococcus sp. PAMC 21323 TaxID=1526927 RepID=UPI000570C6D3|nr:EAL-associated domain-containing protein [Planococcus sp. PAMC 21323]AIY04642.1 diguanylate cyclase/phosphodiesterase [Planococcus sp. PAMC 21323]
MDPLDILENLSDVKPAFQPIVSAVKHTVIGYEVLGRFHFQNEWISLGNFFHDSDVPDEYKVVVDQHLLELAICQLLDSGNDRLLFINRNAKQLLINSGEDFLETLQKYEKKGFSMNRIVLEITEHDFDEDFDRLHHLLMYYKTYGIQIAVDHVGAKSSNIDRIRQLRPHILKVDTSLVRNAKPEAFQDVVQTLTVLARRIGAKLSYENIEDSYQLYFAWKNGGHYYQGFYLAKPAFELPAESFNPLAVREKITAFVQREKSMIQQRYAFTVSLEEKVKKRLSKWQGADTADQFIESLAEPFDKESFRLYVCNSDGQQVSSNYQKRQDHWVLESDHIGSYWAFRPYFLENVMQMKTWHKGILSDVYSDIETTKMIRTFSFPLSDEFYLFIDISNDFISEADYLLFQ